MPALLLSPKSKLQFFERTTMVAVIFLLGFLFFALFVFSDDIEDDR